MDYSEWNTEVNTDFFAFSKQVQDNTVVSEYISGRKVGYKKNEKDLFTISCSLKLNKTEVSAFWNWFSEMGGLAGVFTCSALSSNYLRFNAIPEPQDTDQLYTTLSMEIEEIF